MKRGTVNIKAIYNGTASVTKVYHGATQIWGVKLKEIPPDPDPDP